MLPKKYHAIVFIGILVMLLLLGLHLLGIGYSSGQATAKTAALARNSSQLSSSTNINNALSQNQVYRHPIVYDKLTGATNNQINDVLGAKQPTTGDYPIDHYQQQQQQQQQLQQQQPFNPLIQDDFLFNIHRQQQQQPQQQHPGFPTSSHPLSRHMHPHQIVSMPPPPHQLGPMAPPSIITTQTPSNMQQELSIPMPPPPSPPAPPNANNNSNNNQRQSLLNDPIQPSVDSIPSASSLNNNSSSQLSNQQQQQPTYYTPPIFAYNNFDQNRPINELQNVNQIMPYSYASQPQLQQNNQRRGQQPIIGVPEAPLTIEEYNARQARIRQNQQSPILGEQNERYPINQLNKPQRLGVALLEPQFATTTQQPNNNNNQNLLADPQQQQRHRQQMLDKQLLFGANSFSPNESNNVNSTNNYYPDPALYRTNPQNSNIIRAPYAQTLSQQQQLLQPSISELNNKQQIAQNRNLPPINHIIIEPQQQTNLPLKQQQLIKSNNPNPINHLLIGQQQQEIPTCARQHHQQQEQFNFINMELANSTAQMPILFCNEDLDYPTKDIMRALETYAIDRSIEQLLPQPLIQIHLTSQKLTNNVLQQQQQQQQQQQLTLDTLQPSINILKQQQKQPDVQLVAFDDQQKPNTNLINNFFPSTNYDSMCKSNIFMAQPRRAKNLLGQWKIIVNLPGHKYRGTAISQMVRVEECTKPNSECSIQQSSSISRTSSLPIVAQQLAKSRCLQHYENQRLVAWSHQQGLHLDIFRIPVSCSCHIRK